MYKDLDPEKFRVLLLAPTGVAAVNINGTITHSRHVESKLYPLRDHKCAPLSNKLSENRLIIINWISVVSSELFSQVNQRLN